MRLSLIPPQFYSQRKKYIYYLNKLNRDSFVCALLYRVNRFFSSMSSFVRWIDDEQRLENRSTQGRSWTPVSGSPKATLGFGDLLQGLTELGKPGGLTVTVYYSERIRIKISKGKRRIGQSPGEPRHKLPDVLSHWSLTDTLDSPTNNVWQHVWSIASQEGSPEA